MARREHIWDTLWNVSPADNEFSNYEDAFNFNDMNTSLNDIFSGYENKIQRGSSEAIGQGQRNAASRLASRGIIGGSALDDSVESIATDISKRKFDSLADLGIGKAQADINLKNIFNQNKFKNTLAKQNQENTIFGQQGQKAGALANFLSDWENMDMQKDSQPGTIDDIFSGGADIATVIASIMEMLPKAGATAVAASDIRLKENIEKVGVKNGLNIYHFNYIGNPKRYEGVMAQEVEEIYPDAVGIISGIKYVNYDKIGIDFKEV